jgi:3-hydroxybutyryl-CoA dehydrogenase
VIDGQTAEWVGELMAVGRRMTREPVAEDAPGFLVNQVGRGFTLEAAHPVRGVAGFADVDRCATSAVPHGPL